MDKLLTLTEVSDILQISKKTLYEWVRLSKIKHIKIFSEIRFTKNQIDDILKNGLHAEIPEYNIPVIKVKKKKPQKVVIGSWER